MIRDITVNLRHLMDFGENHFENKILNTGDIVQNGYLKYEFDIRRNITIIQGDSATGAVYCK